MTGRQDGGLRDHLDGSRLFQSQAVPPGEILNPLGQGHGLRQVDFQPDSGLSFRFRNLDPRTISCIKRISLPPP